MKGILLAGGNGTRLYPLTQSVSKHLLPIFDKPMIYYSLSVLMLAGIREILLISKSEDIKQYKRLLGNGEKWGISIEYTIQERPEGVPQAFVLGEKFIGTDNVALILGDNLFYGHGLPYILLEAAKNKTGATVFAYKVKDPEKFGIVTFDKTQKATSIIEKPTNPSSNYAVTGLYFYDNDVIELSKKLKPSKRGELEISDLNSIYLSNDKLHVEILSRGISWLDAGTHSSLLEASHFVQTIENRQGLKIACLEEIALNNKWINKSSVSQIVDNLPVSEYQQYLALLLEDSYA